MWTVAGTKALRYAVPIVAGLLAASCSTLQPAAPYDPEIERTVSAFDKAVLTFIGDMQGLSRTPEGTYGENVAFYRKWNSELAHLRNRAIALEVGESCGPDGVLDEIIEGGFKTVSDALKEGANVIEAVREGALDPARSWAEDGLKAAREQLEAADRQLVAASARLNAANVARADLALLVARIDHWKSEVDRLGAKVAQWNTAFNRIRGAVARMSDTGSDRFQPLEGGCTTLMVTYLADQLRALERFHMKQRDIGIPPRRAPQILISVPIQVILKVQERKKRLHGRGLL